MDFCLIRGLNLETIVGVSSISGWCWASSFKRPDNSKAIQVRIGKVYLIFDKYLV